MPELAQKPTWDEDIFTDKSDMDAVNAISDSAKRMQDTQRPAAEAQAQQNLNVATGKQQGAIRSVSDIAAEVALRHLRGKDLNQLDPQADPNEYMKALGEQIKLMDKHIKDIDSSGTGNVAAKNTLAQVKMLLQQRLHKMQNDLAGIPHEQNPPVVQRMPGGQQ